jgi:tetratricopeptide (TPR) repeat protein
MFPVTPFFASGVVPLIGRPWMNLVLLFSVSLICGLPLSPAWFSQNLPESTTPSPRVRTRVVPRQNPEKAISDLIQKKRWREATNLSLALTRKTPADPTAWYWLGIARLRLPDPVGAVQALRSAEKLGLETALLHGGLGLAYYDLNQFFLFEQQMEKAITLDPLDSKPLFYLGRYHESIKSDVARALVFFDKAMKLQPDDARSVYHKGTCLEQMGQSEEAGECYARAITLVEKANQAFGWPYQGMARLLVENDVEKALTFARRAVEVEGNEYSHHLTLAKICERRRDFPEAIRAARAAANLNPTSSTARYTLFQLYREIGNDQASQEELRLFQKLKESYGPE